ncbi:hypothetical protein CcrC1_gp138c [Caulobacter phage C1]|nr:hypothetical protein CcrC1_gp138c [Caulobacter phage C1]UTU08367.1 hypothetical protein CcrC2_gp139c [Caulobacter phage C2]UTU08884.1 hypothetical protein CcrJ4_gp133c [Caulobacter phage J4]UTU09440.1 hypothetical protein CcrBL47_gp154c [Caulobacter phage BL47]UTU10000.1 hypothetical protein CcrRB23_gp138c [Caulobacter phage RB23]WGN97025.1 hypothetical protein [Bertelyvirus sp.]
MAMNVLVRATERQLAEPINPNGLKGVINIIPEIGGGFLYAALAPGREVGDDLQVQVFPASKGSFATVLIFALPHYGVANPRIVFADRAPNITDAMALYAGAIEQKDLDFDGKADVEGDGPGYQRLGEAPGVPLVALLRWTGSFWFCYARSLGMMTTDSLSL